MKWFYEQFLLQHDNKAGTPYEVSVYPHLTVCAFVNWPTELPPQNPAAVLPLCYRDSQHGFYTWRNRWKDEDDVVITVLTQDTKGFMGEKADSSFHIWAYGNKLAWGRIPGPVEYWETSENGGTSMMRFRNGMSVAVDLSGKSGADVVLIATGAFEGEQLMVGDQIVTVKCLTKADIPVIEVVDDHLRLGNRDVLIKNGKVVFP
jgi:hypothetical protein